MTKFYGVVLGLIWLITGCSQTDQIIRSKDRKADINRMLKVQQELTSKSVVPVWDVFKQQLSPNEKELLEFMYAYMPLSDLADYPAEFHLKNVQYALKARKEMAWGKEIPEEEFVHFVLPLRVNNENLDNFREVMYPELAKRIKGLEMKQAALEINHWCHEKVNYRGTDSRTSAPLSTIRKTFGRCGEESTFTVTAMRTAGIPARQVYTPRWAHSDDNHAWVEVWIKGKWYFLGACEPDADLNMGWFAEPSTRTMLVHTRAFGHYYGSETVITPEDRFSELNLTGNYAKVKTVKVIVKDSEGKRIPGAKVQFQLYNYAEYYPIATDMTDTKGEASLLTGMGDLIVRGAKGDLMGYKKLSVPTTDTLEVILSKGVSGMKTENFDLVPPPAGKTSINVSEAARKENTRRLGYEDSIRNATMKTFKDSAWSSALAQKLGLSTDSVRRFIKLSYGNWDQISSYLEKNSAAYRSSVLVLAGQLSAKDFSDVQESILTDHLVTAAKVGRADQNVSAEIYSKYILNPRMANEMLTAWRSFLNKSFDETTQREFKSDVPSLVEWIRKNIRIDDVANKHSRSPLSPIGVYNLRVSDPFSRDLFFVAVCRSLGIPARLHPETQKPEYFVKGEWIRAGFESEAVKKPEWGTLQLTNQNNPLDPQYSMHFTIGVLENGFYKTLDFQEGEKIGSFEKGVALEVGNYVLITGNRMPDGSVLSNMTPFVVEKGKTTIVPLVIRRQSGGMKATGKLDLTRLMLQEGKIQNSYSNLLGNKPAVIVLMDPDKEPSKHILNDLGPVAEKFNEWGGRFIFAMNAERFSQAGVLKTYTLPKDYLFGVDVKDLLLENLTQQYGSGLKDKLPLVIYCDTKGEIYYFSSGYKIGIGDELLKAIKSCSEAAGCGVKASCTK